jgi:hypothetical protein
MNNLIIPPPLPFADTTVGEAVLAAKTLGVSTESVVNDVREGPTNVRTNPSKVYDRFLIPIGERVRIRTDGLNDAARAVAEADTMAQVSKGLDELEQAVETEDGHKLTSTGLKGGGMYRSAIAKFREWLKDPIHKETPFDIFAKGNKKLPFWTWSTLPGVTCPGAGACLTKENGKRGWCYSFSSWRYIYPYFRQLQNTILIRLADKSPIERDARAKFEPGQVVRLYVDGDIDSLDTLTYWMHFVDRFPEVQFYGYSKSWGIFQQWHDRNGGRWPSNYVINLSSGTSLERRYANEPEVFRGIVDRMRNLVNPETGHRLVRGTFRAIKVEGTKAPKMNKEEMEAGVWKKNRPKFEAHRAAVAAKARELKITGDTDGKGIFVCPGYCGACLPRGGHACGRTDMKDVAIVIGIH